MSSLAVVVAAAGMAVLVGGAAKASERTVLVCLDPGGNAAVIDGGRAAASRVFKHAGIRLDWRNSERPCLQGNGIVVTVALMTLPEQLPGALAYALPYERTHIVLMYDRVLETVPRPAVSVLMGYVLAHEIAHMLQGVSRHSDSGVMKAHWDRHDYDDMELGRLRFASEDIDMMHEGPERPAQMDGSGQVTARSIIAGTTPSKR